MDLILGTHWLYNDMSAEIPPVKEEAKEEEEEESKQQQRETDASNTEKGNSPPTMEGSQTSWLQIMDEAEKNASVQLIDAEEFHHAKQGQQDNEETVEMQTEATAPTATPDHHLIGATTTTAIVDQEVCEQTVPVVNKKKETVPLLHYLCDYFKCSIRELQVVFQNLEKRRQLIEHLRNGEVQLWTTHIRPLTRNFTVRCNDISAQNAHMLPAYRGYLGITVRAHYYIKHRVKLRHPYFPCIIEYGGGSHCSFFPLEVLTVIK